jgi:hypothetical protein
LRWALLRTKLAKISGPDYIRTLEARGIPRSHAHTLTESLANVERHLLNAEYGLEEFRSLPIARATAELYVSELRQALTRVADAIHEWASGVYAAHRFRQLAGSIFDRLKTSSDSTLARLCPDAIAKLNHAIERAGTDNPEAWSAAAMSCRRALKDFADVVYQPRSDLVEGRKVGPEEYKNRLWAFAKSRGVSALEEEALSVEEIDGLGKSLDRVYDLDSKGVHNKVTKREADMLVVRTYILLSQLSSLSSTA